MSDGCTDCGRKGGCDARKGPMFAAIDEALGRLYPSRSWSERHEDDELRAAVDPALGAALADRLAGKLSALALHQAGRPDEYCDFVYVLCMGRTPSLLELREGLCPPEQAGLEGAGGDGEPGDQFTEHYLRVALSTLAPFAAVQQVALRASRTDDVLIVEEAARAGVFDAVLLPRFQKLVAVLAELGVRHLDFGDIADPPAGFDAGDYGERFGGAPAIANYLFYPQPCSSITTAVVPLALP
jgi:hypothetical protein